MSSIFPIKRYGRNNANYTPFGVLTAFDDLFTLDMPSRTHRSYNTTPRANVVKTDSGYGIELAVPGFSRDEFELNVNNDKLTIRMGTEDTKEYEDKLVHREYRFTDFIPFFFLY